MAAYADTHLVVDSNGPASEVRRLDDEQRVAELARMLAGLGSPTPPGRTRPRITRHGPGGVRGTLTQTQSGLLLV